MSFVSTSESTTATPTPPSQQQLQNPKGNPVTIIDQSPTNLSNTVDSLKILPFLERKDYEDIVHKLLSEHPELQNEFNDYLKPRLDLKVNGERPKNLFKIRVRTSPTWKDDERLNGGFRNQFEIDKFYREVEAFRVANRPVDAFLRLAIALGDLQKIMENAKFEYDVEEHMYENFNAEILKTVRMINPSTITQEIRDKIWQAKNWILHFDEVLGCLEEHTFESSLKCISELLGEPDAIEKKDSFQYDNEGSFNHSDTGNDDADSDNSNYDDYPAKRQQVQSAYGVDYYPVTVSSDGIVLPPLRGSILTNGDQQEPLSLPHINSLPQFPPGHPSQQPPLQQFENPPQNKFRGPS